MPLTWTVERPWEDYFTLVQWDQRGAGKTYASNDPKVIAPTMTIPQMTSDTAEVVRYLRERLHKRKIIVVGHSLGSVPGVALAQQHPEWMYAYVGVGQYVSSQLNEKAYL
jgi:proline iminopeptidase